MIELTFSKSGIAYREAGHAVIGRILDLACGPATIVPNEEGGSLGHSKDFDPSQKISDALAQGFVRNEATVREKIAMMVMAGAAAMVELLGIDPAETGDSRDVEEISLMLNAAGYDTGEALTKRDRQLRQKTRRLIRTHRDKIDRVAKALLERSRLSAAEIDNLMCQP